MRLYIPLLRQARVLDGSSSVSAFRRWARRVLATEHVERKEFQRTEKLKPSSVQEMHIADCVGHKNDERHESAKGVKVEQGDQGYGQPDQTTYSLRISRLPYLQW